MLVKGATGDEKNASVNQVFFSLGNDSSTVQCQAITNTDLLLVGPSGTDFLKLGCHFIEFPMC